MHDSGFDSSPDGAIRLGNVAAIGETALSQ